MGNCTSQGGSGGGEGPLTHPDRTPSDSRRRIRRADRVRERKRLEMLGNSMRNSSQLQPPPSSQGSSSSPSDYRSTNDPDLVSADSSGHRFYSVLSTATMAPGARPKSQTEEQDAVPDMIGFPMLEGSEPETSSPHRLRNSIPSTSQGDDQTGNPTSVTSSARNLMELVPMTPDPRKEVPTATTRNPFTPPCTELQITPEPRDEGRQFAARTVQCSPGPAVKHSFLLPDGDADVPLSFSKAQSDSMAGGQGNLYGLSVSDTMVSSEGRSSVSGVE